MAAPELTEIEFLRHVIQAGPHLMWFLGAGASRSSGLPTATDIIWDLKRKLYCLEQNQDVRDHDAANKAVQTRIQGYMDSRGFPPLWDPREYSFYFERTFGNDYAAQQKYLNDALSTQRISSTIGHRALAALLCMDRARLVFTTNFDEVVETAYSAMAGKNLATFHLEGSYAALEALNGDQFPFYAKVHGDFRYQSVKNLSKDLLSNDQELQKCLVAAATRFGLIMAGYSGRDGNVMSMLRAAIDQNNAFPHGLFWTAPKISGVAQNVRELMDYAHSRGIKCGLVQTGTFDEMLSKIWKNIEKRPKELDEKVRTAIAKPVSIALPTPGSRYPMLRTNALRIAKLPESCGTIEYDGEIVMGDVRSAAFNARPDCTLAYTDRLLFWGGAGELAKVLDATKIRKVENYEFENLIDSVDNSGTMKSFVEETIAIAAVRDKPVYLRKDDRTWYAVVKHDAATQDIYEPLRKALGYRGSLAPVSGKVFGLQDVYWAESVSMRIEERNGALWLMLRPDVWISPLKERENAEDFLRARKLKRYNTQAFDMLSAWIQILLGNIGQGQTVAISAFPASDYSAKFEISTRTAYSKRNAAHG
ncbi:SIR2 family protein [Peristeroidobacter soli]|uniref:SIR2 family protein n=1 Tax=Peristeroidobacter soli TaxID=2497877 RepID=UPI00101DD4AE|nr:SIR2 family protein [Peristeroidobacter soli]